MSAGISETIKTKKLGLGKQILAQRKFISAGCHAYCNAYNARISLGPTFVKFLQKSKWNLVLII